MKAPIKNATETGRWLPVAIAGVQPLTLAYHGEGAAELMEISFNS